MICRRSAPMVYWDNPITAYSRDGHIAVAAQLRSATPNEALGSKRIIAEREICGFLITEATGAIQFLGQMAPVASVIKILPERRCLTAFRSPVFDTTSPGVGGRLKPRCARHGNLTPPRISPSCPHENGGQEYHDCLTGSLRNSLSSCFVDGWVPLAALYWPSFMRKTAQAGLGASSSVALSLLALRQGTYFNCRM